MTPALLYIGAILNLGFGIFHIFFWKLFKWKDEILKVSRINRGIFQVLNIMIIFIFFCFAAVTIFFKDELISTELGKFVLLIISLFWFIRSALQFIFFRIKNIFSIALFAAFILLGVLYLLPVIHSHIQ